MFEKTLKKTRSHRAIAIVKATFRAAENLAHKQKFAYQQSALQNVICASHTQNTVPGTKCVYSRVTGARLVHLQAKLLIFEWTSTFARCKRAFGPTTTKSTITDNPQALFITWQNEFIMTTCSCWHGCTIALLTLLFMLTESWPTIRST